MLELEVIPEHGLSSETIEFILGMNFSHAVAAIQSLVGSVKGVQILYSEKEPLSVDLVINLTQDGIKLIFDPINQRLKTIEVYDLSLLKLKYSDAFFNCPDIAPTIEQIDLTFGATHPGVFDAERRVFTLTFRGLSFEFHADTQFQRLKMISSGKMANDREQQSPTYGGIRQELGRLQFPPGESPRVSRMYIYAGNSLTDCQAPSLPSPRYPCIHHESIQVLRRDRRTIGLRVRLLSTPNIDNARSDIQASDDALNDEIERRERNNENADDSIRQTNVDNDNIPRNVVCRDVLFDDSAQDVISALGAPARIFFKSEDKMKIHSPNAHRKSATQKSDYFYNYFTLGFDVLFDARTNGVKKFVLHTNYPGHYNFNMYQRCQFELPLYPDSTYMQPQYMTPVTISPFSRWDEISERIKPSERPVVLNRASSTNTTNPFGSTFCYGYQDIIFEVMPNSHIASITLYNQIHGSRHVNRLTGAGGGAGGAATRTNKNAFA